MIEEKSTEAPSIPQTETGAPLTKITEHEAFAVPCEGQVSLQHITVTANHLAIKGGWELVHVQASSPEIVFLVMKRTLTRDPLTGTVTPNPEDSFRFALSGKSLPKISKKRIVKPPAGFNPKRFKGRR